MNGFEYHAWKGKVRVLLQDAADLVRSFQPVVGGKPLESDVHGRFIDQIAAMCEAYNAGLKDNQRAGVAICLLKARPEDIKQLAKVARAIYDSSIKPLDDDKANH